MVRVVPPMIWASMAQPDGSLDKNLSDIILADILEVDLPTTLPKTREGGANETSSTALSIRMGRKVEGSCTCFSRSWPERSTSRVDYLGAFRGSRQWHRCTFIYDGLVLACCGRWGFWHQTHTIYCRNLWEDFTGCKCYAIGPLRHKVPAKRMDNDRS